MSNNFLILIAIVNSTILGWDVGQYLAFRETGFAIFFLIGILIVNFSAFAPSLYQQDLDLFNQ